MRDSSIRETFHETLNAVRIGFILGGVVLLGLGAGCSMMNRADQQSSSEARAVEYLTREVPMWSRENGCFSCHHNGDGAKALLLAARQGYPVPPEALEDTLDWLGAPRRWPENKGDPGFSDQRLANLQFGAALAEAAASGKVPPSRAMRDASMAILEDQASEGSWPIEPHNPAGSPTTYGSGLATVVAALTLERLKAGETERSLARQWLRQLRPVNVPDAAALILTEGMKRDPPTDTLKSDSFEFLRRAQGASGGWGPYADSPAEPYDSALALLALSALEPTPERRGMIRRGRRFLESIQLEDGSWPATTRPPGEDSYAQQVSTTSWVLQALLATREARD